MTLVVGTRLGPYEILAPLGAGGMGEVYRARDRKLDRDVAIKVLAAALVSDPAALSRFQRESKIVAALSHPNILAIHDFGTESLSSGAQVEYAVMELLDGETLRKKLDSGPLSVRKAIDYALQVAHGIAAAHEKGVVHRDLKPENLFVLKDGRVKILDFGLAYLGTAFATPVGLSAQTMLRETTPGVIVGTVAYMSPEQVRGKEVDWRSDIFTLGVVLYEMISGQRPFRGESAADTMSAILKEDPPEFALGSVPSTALDRLIRRCLEKDPGERLQSARDLAFALEAIAGTSSSSGTASLDARLPGRVRLKTIWAAVGLVVGLIVGAASQFVARPRTPLRPVRLSAVLSGNDVLGLSDPAIAISPDGETLVFPVGRAPTLGQHLARRSMTEGEVGSIPDSDGAVGQFFSPDGQWLGFSRVYNQTGGAKLWKMPLGGGSPQALVDVTFEVGASWGDDGTIVFAPSYDSALWRVPAGGGAAEPLTTLGKDESSHVWPDILPGAKAVIYTAEVSGQPFDNARIVVRPLPSGEPHLLIEGGSGAKYARSGHLVFGRGNKLLAVPFDAKRLAITGPPIPVLDGVSDDPALGTVRFALSNQGTLAYVAGGGPRAQRSLVWYDRRGTTEPLGDIRGHFLSGRLSPDGTRIALQIQSANDQLWLYDISTSTLSRLTVEGENSTPVWTPDGRRLIFTSNRSGNFNLFWIASDGSGSIEQIASTPVAPLQPVSVAPDGKTIAFVHQEPKAAPDIWTVRLDGDRTPHPLARTAFAEVSPQISPDGRRIAYSSNESGQFEVYVQAFPEPTAKRQISVNGGLQPMWGKNGRELFFTSSAWDAIMVADVGLGESLSSGKARVLFRMDKPILDYEPAPDGRFLMIQRSEEETSTRQIEIVLNWFDELKRRVPTR